MELFEFIVQAMLVIGGMMALIGVIGQKFESHRRFSVGIMTYVMIIGGVIFLSGAVLGLIILMPLKAILGA